MKLLFVHPALGNQGGAQLAYYWLVKGLASRGHRIIYATPKQAPGVAEELSGLGIAVVPLDARHEIDKIIMLAKQVDLVITGNYPATLWVGLARRSRSDFPPAICHAAEPPRQLYEEAISPHFLASSLDPKFYFPWSRSLRRRRIASAINLDQRAVDRFDEMIAIGNYAGSLFEKAYHKKTKAIPLGVGDMTPQPQTFPDGAFTFLAPAGIEPIKNFVTIIKAFASAAKHSDDIRLILTGDGFWRKKAEALAKRFGIEKKTVFSGWVSREALKDYYRACHAVIYVPLDEPFGLVACEAGIFGKPAIVSNHGGPSEIVKDMETGFHVNPFDPEQSAGRMMELYHDRDRGAQLGKAAMERITSWFNHEEYLKKFESVLKDHVG